MGGRRRGRGKGVAGGGLGGRKGGNAGESAGGEALGGRWLWRTLGAGGLQWTKAPIGVWGGEICGSPMSFGRPWGYDGHKIKIIIATFYFHR